MMPLDFAAWIKTTDRFKGMDPNVAMRSSAAKKEYADYCDRYETKIGERLEILRKKQEIRLEHSIDAFTHQNSDIPTKNLPLWHDKLRAIPNELVRSALFNARNHKNERDYMKGEVIASIGESEVRYTGQELRQDDETVWLQVLHLCRTEKLGTTIGVRRLAFLESIKWSPTKANYERLHSCLDRLSATNIEVKSKRLKSRVAVSLIRKYKLDDESKLMLIEIEPEVHALFDDCYTLCEWDQRQSLPSGLTTWMHAYFASHEKPFPIKIETLTSGAGVHFTAKADAKRSIKKALEKLVEIEFLVRFKIEKDLVSVVRKK